MANPLVQQGIVNRLKASVVFASHPELNVTAPYLGREGIRLALEGDGATYLPTLTGGVPSPEPYQICMVTINLLKTQALSATYKGQYEDNVLIGDLTIRPDTTTGLSPYDLTNCALVSVAEQDYAGNEAVWRINIRGYYNINSNLFS